MFKKFFHAFTILFVILGLLSFAAPASALGNKRALKGTIIAIDTRAKTMLVAPIRGARVNIRVVRTTSITRNGKPGNFAKLRVGDKVNLNYFVSTKQASKVADTSSRYEIHGTVEAVDTATSTVTVASEEGGNSVVLKVDSSTVIQRNHAPAALADLLVGDKVEAKYDSATMLASLIKTEVEDSELHGTIAALDLTAKTITITPELGGADVVLNVSDSTVFKKNDAVVAFADMVVGDKVEAEYDSVSMIASKIEVEDSELHGTIAALDLTAKTITITPELGGADVVLNVSDSTVFKKNDAVVAFADLVVGDRVEAEYDSVSMIASKIEVED